MNPWKKRLGCEVKVCKAGDCDSIRMQFCALRIAYLDRVAYLKGLRDRSKNPDIKDRINKLLRGMDAE